MTDKILIATQNLGKAEEFAELLSDLGFEMETLYDYPDLPEIIEDGKSFSENALKKAREISQLTNRVVIADDSGLMVKALNGAPGIYSARYAGEPKSDQRNIEKLLAEMENVAQDERQAKFHTTIAVVAPDKEPLIVEGELEGFILTEPRGHHGFGYDPVFYLPEKDKTLAEMSTDEKNKNSHRARAVKNLSIQFSEWLKK